MIQVTTTDNTISEKIIFYSPNAIFYYTSHTYFSRVLQCLTMNERFCYRKKRTYQFRKVILINLLKMALMKYNVVGQVGLAGLYAAIRVAKGFVFVRDHVKVRHLPCCPKLNLSRTYYRLPTLSTQHFVSLMFLQNIKKNNVWANRNFSEKIFSS